LRLVEEAGRRNETVDDTADRVLRGHLPVILVRIARLQPWVAWSSYGLGWSPAEGQSGSSAKDVGTSNGASSERHHAALVTVLHLICVMPKSAARHPGPMT